MRVQRLVHRLAAVASIVTPLLLALTAAHQMSWHDQTQRTTVLAEVALDRAGQITEQINHAFKSMHVYAPSQACSKAAVDFMRSVDLSSGLLQGVGYLTRNALQCSSLGSVPTHVGPPDFISASGTAFRRGRTLAEARRSPLLLVSNPEGYTALVHPDLLFSFDRTDTTQPEGIISDSTRDTILSRGATTFDWHNIPLDPRKDTDTFVESGHIVTWARSERWDHFAYAAVPRAAQTAQFWELAALLLPVGLLAGLACLFLTLRALASRGSLPALFRSALKRGEISTVYQPIVDMRSGEWVGAEVLGRWRRPNGELISPDIFVPIAEQHGLIRQLTNAVVTSALAELGATVAARRHFFLSINVTSTDLVAPDFAPGLIQLCLQHGIPPSAIHLEVTERIEVKLDAELDSIAMLRGAGFQVGIDDFGVGYSNLAYLEKLSLDYLKIDRAFVAGLARTSFGGQVIDHIIDIARTRRLEIIAEGVETQEQRAALVARGVFLAQGWLFAKALPATLLTEGLATLCPGLSEAPTVDAPVAPPVHLLTGTG